MWYFAWILGLPLAAIFAVMNAMWLEMKEDEHIIEDSARAQPSDASRR
jgi:cyd operon protein YbgT